jgi:hypothetical protein
MPPISLSPPPAGASQIRRPTYSIPLYQKQNGGRVSNASSNNARTLTASAPGSTSPASPSTPHLPLDVARAPSFRANR